MASQTDKFLKNIVGATGHISDYVQLISSSGDFTTIKDLHVILNSWNNILLTNRRTYVGNPDYGSDLYKYVFEPADSTTEEGIKEEIQFRLMQYDDRAMITYIDVSFLRNQHGYVVEVGFEYETESGILTTTINNKELLNIES